MIRRWPLSIVASLVMALIAVCPIPQATATNPGDNGRIFFSAVSQDLSSWEIASIAADGGDFRYLTDHPAYDLMPAVSPDGRRVAFRSARDGVRRLYTMNADGSGTRLVTEKPCQGGITWSPSGRRIAFTGTDQRDRYQLFVTSVKTGRTRKITSFHGPEADLDRWWWDHLQADWSPDGRRIAFTTLRVDGGFALMTIRPDGSHLRSVIGNRDAGLPSWSPDGRTLAFVSSNTLSGTQRCWEQGEVCAGSIFTSTRGADVQQVTDGTIVPYEIAWSPDGTRIGFLGDAHNGNDIYSIKPDGSELEALYTNATNEWGLSWQALP